MKGTVHANEDKFILSECFGIYNCFSKGFEGETEIDIEEDTPEKKGQRNAASWKQSLPGKTVMRTKLDVVCSSETVSN